jgi:hypothetical protein
VGIANFLNGRDKSIGSAGRSGTTAQAEPPGHSQCVAAHQGVVLVAGAAILAIDIRKQSSPPLSMTPGVRPVNWRPGH